jgi:hypothetical protein
MRSCRQDAIEFPEEKPVNKESDAKLRLIQIR